MKNNILNYIDEVPNTSDKALDTRLPLAIKQMQAVSVASYGLQTVVDIENSAVPAFAQMHVNGIYLDRDAWMDIVHDTEKVHEKNVKHLDTFFSSVVGSKHNPPVTNLEEIERQWREETDKEFRAEFRKEFYAARRALSDWKEAREDAEGEAAINYGSPSQLTAALRKMGFGVRKLPNTSDKALEALPDPVIKAIQAYRTTAKALTTYGVDFLKHINEVTGRVHSNVNQLGAATGRTSSTNPNFFSAETEALTMNGWTPFKDLVADDLVAQFSIRDHSITFAQPLSLTSQPTSSLLHLHTDGRQVDMLVAPDHECLIQSRKTDAWKTVPAQYYPNDGRQYVAGRYVGGGVHYTSSQIAIIAALQADAHVNKWEVRWVFKKPRKLERLREALEAAQVSYRFSYSPQTGRMSLSVKSADIPDWLTGKKFFGPWVLSLTADSLDMLATEVWLWDGCAASLSHYSSSFKPNADWVQIIQALASTRAKLRPYRNSNPNSKLNWQVDAGRNSYAMTSNCRKELVPYDGDVYGLVMPNGTAITRYGNTVAISIAGNPDISGSMALSTTAKLAA